MKSLLKLSVAFYLILPLFLAMGFSASAQEAEGIITESGGFDDFDEFETEDEFEFDFEDDGYRPLDDIVDRTLDQERLILGYGTLREADIFWQKRLWRELDLREKINLSFLYPEAYFVQLLIDGIINGDISSYSEDKFMEKQSPTDVESMLFNMDTSYVTNVDTYEQELKVIRNDLDIASITKIRVKEIWYFDQRHSVMKNRILGIAPISNVNDENGNFLFEQPLFWIYYPDAREYLSQFRVFIAGNDATQMSWTDWLDMRLFSSFIYKETNVLSNRLKDYKSLEEDGVARLLRGREIEEEIFNWEQDLWAY